MSLDSFQDSLFEDPIGNRFRNSREKLRWSKESVAQQLKLPLSIIDAIEAENWGRLGAPIYIRSYVGSYAKILGMSPDVVDEVIRSQPSSTPPLVNNGSPAARGGRSFDRGVLKLGSVVMTGVIVSLVVILATHLQSRSPAADIVPLDPPATAGVVAPMSPTAPSAQALPATQPSASVESAQNRAAAQAPVMASLTPSLPTDASGHPDDLVLNFRGESWVDVVNAAGQHTERGLLPAGTQRRFARGEIARITVGNAEAVEASQGGQTVDLSPFREANVARFAVSSEGKVVASGD